MDKRLERFEKHPHYIARDTLLEIQAILTEVEIEADMKSTNSLRAVITLTLGEISRKRSE